jgi:hypothetical protein
MVEALVREKKRRREEWSDPATELTTIAKISSMETDIAWLKKYLSEMSTGFDNRLKRIESRQWWVLGSVVVLGLVAIFLAVLPKI